MSKKNDGRCVSHKPSADSDFPAAATDDSRRWLTTADDSRCCDITPLPRLGLPSARDGEEIRIRVGQRHGQRLDPHAVDLRKQGVPVADRELGEGAYAAPGVFRIRLAPHPDLAEAAGVGADERRVCGREEAVRRRKQARRAVEREAVPPLAVDAERRFGERGDHIAARRRHRQIPQRRIADQRRLAERIIDDLDGNAEHPAQSLPQRRMPRFGGRRVFENQQAGHSFSSIIGLALRRNTGMRRGGAFSAARVQKPKLIPKPSRPGRRSGPGRDGFAFYVL